MDTWRSDVFFSVGEAATSKWTHGEVAVFGSTVYRIFALKCQKLRTPLASLAPCVMKETNSCFLRIARKALVRIQQNLYTEFEWISRSNLQNFIFS